MKYDALAIEGEVLDYWDNNSIYKKIKEKNYGKKKYYFLDGPPYTSGKIHIGQAWNKSMKDMVQRYKRMKGLDVWDRAGYDMHGLPTAHKVEAKFGIKSKDEIPNFGIDKFVDECRKLALENMEQMNADFKRLGVWMDFENAYMPITKEFIEAEWWLIKKAHENERLYEGKRTMHWCSTCATSLAKHELEYKEIRDNSIFLKFQIKGTNEYLIIWTTTPWTIPFNLAVMVNPKLDYVKAKVEDEVWIIAKALVAPVVQTVANKSYTVVEEIKGEELEGLQYVHPLADQIRDYQEIKAEKLHTVLMSSEYVDVTSGSGLVHCAPGCGPEDFEVGHRNGLPAFNNVDEYGFFGSSMGEFKGKRAKLDDKYFIESLKERNALIATTQVDHDYAHCWRCKQPVIFRTTNQWFFKIEDLKEEMRQLNQKIHWVPDWAGSRQFDSWLDNLRDNSITRQRYWGCPVPIWKCDDCNEYDVIDKVEELENLTGQKIEKLHRPWIDDVKWKCKCGGERIRVEDILDVWIDAGISSWSCLDFPNREDLFNELFPADFILEGKDQIRGWFNLLFVASMVSMKKPSYKAVYMHGFVQDSDGRKMSKSLGNIISPYEVIEKYGSDTLRYYMIGGAKAGVDINYNFDDIKVKNRNLVVLWNVHNYVINYAKEIDVNPLELDVNILENSSLEEKYILSKLDSTIQKVTELFEVYKIEEIPMHIENLYLELSRTYIQLIRDKAALGSEDEKKLVLYVMYNVLFETLKMFSTVAPFITEKMYLNFKDAFGLEKESIHHYDWPDVEVGSINETLEDNFEIVKMVIQSALAAREKAKLGLRWPIGELVVETSSDTVNQAVREMYDIIKTQVNTKEILLVDKVDGVEELVKPDFAKIKPDFGENTGKVIEAINTNKDILSVIRKDGKYDLDGLNIVSEHLIVQKQTPANLEGSDFRNGTVFVNTDRTVELDNEGYTRELTRRIQNARKIDGLAKQDNIDLYLLIPEGISLDEDIIKEKCGVNKLELSKSQEYHTKIEEKIKDKVFEIHFSKV